MSLKNVVGEREPEHDSFDILDASHGELVEMPVAPASMDALADRAALVLRFAVLARHAGAPSQHSRTVPGTRLIRIGAVLGLRRRTIDPDPLAMRPLDVLGGREAAVGEVTSRNMADCRAQPFQHWPHQAAIGAGVADLE